MQEVIMENDKRSTRAERSVDKRSTRAERSVDKRSTPQNGSVDSTIQRLKTIEGHLKGVIRMVEEDAYCIDVIRQIQAVEAALNKVSSRILEDHLNSCVITAIQGNDKKERERVLKEISEVFEMSTKV